MTEVWHGERIADALDMCAPWTTQKVAEFGETMLRAYDTWRRIHGRGAAVVEYTQIRDLVRTGTSMIDVPRELGLPMADVTEIITNHAPSPIWRWNEYDWLHAEAVLYDRARTMTRQQLQDELGVGHGTIEHLCDLYGVVYNADANDRLLSMREALLAGLHPTDAMVVVADDGFEATYNQLYQMRRKMAERGEVPVEMPPVRHVESVRVVA